ncbi:hypothetical protein Taro_056727, partial [Colocasia esculenta]|nr:hypothetical protein [Colocasia esculenta]
LHKEAGSNYGPAGDGGALAGCAGPDLELAAARGAVVQAAGPTAGPIGLCDAGVEAPRFAQGEELGDWACHLKPIGGAC